MDNADNDMPERGSGKEPEQQFASRACLSLPRNLFSFHRPAHHTLLHIKKHSPASCLRSNSVP